MAIGRCTCASAAGKEVPPLRQRGVGHVVCSIWPLPDWSLCPTLRVVTIKLMRQYARCARRGVRRRSIP